MHTATHAQNNQPIILTRHNSGECIEKTLANGCCIIYSAKSPIKNTDNEDAAAIIPISDTQAVLVVADGLGGHTNGKEAASITVNEIARNTRNSIENNELVINGIMEGISIAHDRIMTEYNNAATTIAVVELEGQKVKTYHAGDSEIIVTGQRGKMKLRTAVHSPIGDALERGLIDENMAMFHSKRHLISNAVGLTDMNLQLGRPYYLARYDTLLLGSDGLFDNLFKKEIIGIIRHGNLANCAYRLVEKAKLRMYNRFPEQPHKPDDLSFILFRLS